MGELENRPNQSGGSGDATDPRSMEQLIQSVRQDLRSLQQDLTSSLNQDIGKLQAEKSRLQNEIEKLQAQHQALQSQHQILLSQQQLAQQRLWAKQLAQALAGHLYSLLAQRIAQSDAIAQEQGPSLPSLPNRHPGKLSPQATQQLLALDSALTQTLGTLQQDLTSYQSGLAQQLQRMQNLEQQGEALLEALVSRLSQKLQVESSRTGRAAERAYPAAALPPPVVPSTQQALPPVSPRPLPAAPLGDGTPVPPPPPLPAPEPVPPPHRKADGLDLGGFVPTLVALVLLLLGVYVLIRWLGEVPLAPTFLIPFLLLVVLGAIAFFLYPRVLKPQPGKPHREVAPQSVQGPLAAGRAALNQLSSAQIGLVFILTSTLALSLHNVVVGIVGGPVSIFGLFNVGNFITLNSLDDSLLILWLRMLIVVPVMGVIAKVLHPPVWRDVRKFVLSKDRRLMVNVIGSGAFLFGSQVFIYLAIAATSPGVAVTILFMYPLVTVPLAWFLFGDRPTSLRVGVMLTILVGVILTAFPRLAATTNLSLQGILAAVVSGVLFALYLVSMQISFRKLHPVPVSFIQFVTIFVLTNIMLIPFGIQEPPRDLLGVLVGGLILGSLTLIGYLLNNLGVKMMGAARASIVAASGPVLTALLAFLITPSQRTALQPVQMGGIVLVTAAVLALSFEKMLAQGKVSRAGRS